MTVSVAVYNAFNADEPLPGHDAERYVDLSAVRGDSKVAQRLVQRIKNAENNISFHLLMGHTKCGKTTELNRAVYMLEQEGYATVNFDVAEEATRQFEYTTVLLLIAAHIVDQLGRRQPKAIRVKGSSAKRLAEFLVEKQITATGQFSGDATAKVEAKAAPGLLTRLLGEFGIAAEMRGGFQKSRAITIKIEADTRNFIEAVQELIKDGSDKVLAAGLKGLVVVCDGCDKLDLQATDEKGVSQDLQYNMFVGHAPDLQAIPCHVIYTVPISIKANLGDIWEQTPEFVPAIPVSTSSRIPEEVAREGRAKLEEVVLRRLKVLEKNFDDIFSDTNQLQRLIDASGGHISDLLLLVREAILEAQTDGAEKISESHIQRSIRNRAREYRALIEGDYLETLIRIDELKTTVSSDTYRELVFKKLVLEYISGMESVIDLHPLVAASDAYRSFSSQ